MKQYFLDSIKIEYCNTTSTNIFASLSNNLCTNCKEIPIPSYKSAQNQKETFCKKCYESQKNESWVLIDPNIFEIEALHQLSIHCQYWKNGCKEIFNLNTLEEMTIHHKKCVYDLNITFSSEGRLKMIECDKMNQSETIEKLEKRITDIEQKYEDLKQSFKEELSMITETIKTNEENSKLIIIFLQEKLKENEKKLEKKIKDDDEEKESKLKINQNDYIIENTKNIELKEEEKIVPENNITEVISDAQVVLASKEISQKIEETIISPQLIKKSFGDIIFETGLFDHLNIRDLKLIFRASEHEFKSSAFHSKCDNKGPTLTIIKTNNGNLFGGYTPISWNSTIWDFCKDESNSSFLFSLTKKTKHKLIQPDYATKNNKANLGPVFGGGFDLCISNDCNKNDDSLSNLGKSYETSHSYESVEARSHLSGFNKYFVVEDYEVYSVII